MCRNRHLYDTLYTIIYTILIVSVCVMYLKYRITILIIIIISLDQILLSYISNTSNIIIVYFKHIIHAVLNTINEWTTY